MAKLSVDKQTFSSMLDSLCGMSCEDLDEQEDHARWWHGSRKVMEALQNLDRWMTETRGLKSPLSASASS